MTWRQMNSSGASLFWIAERRSPRGFNRIAEGLSEFGRLRLTAGRSGGAPRGFRDPLTPPRLRMKVRLREEVVVNDRAPDDTDGLIEVPGTKPDDMQSRHIAFGIAGAEIVDDTAPVGHRI